MDTVVTLTKRNAGFAADGFDPSLRMLPTLRTIVVGCVDPRVDPAHVLGLEQGETAVLRNVGGRITPAALDELAMLRTVTQAAGGDVAAGWNMVVLQHTDCGITRLATATIGSYLGVEEEQVAQQAVNDPRAAVALDVEKLRADARIAGAVLVTGLVYDVATGLVATVIGPEPRVVGASA